MIQEMRNGSKTVLLNQLIHSGQLDRDIRSFEYITKRFNLITPANGLLGKKTQRVSFSQVASWWQDAVKAGDIVNNLDLYVGIPYCEGPKRCDYCMYYSTTSFSENDINKYINTLIEIMDEVGIIFNKFKLNSLYIGGGTPNILSFEQLKSLLDGINKNFSFQDDCSKNCENSPHLFSEDKARLLHGSGINRISFGIQSFDSNVLLQNHRPFVSVHEMASILETTRRIGFKQINVDQMIGIKGQSIRNIVSSFNDLAKLGPDRITIYTNRHFSFSKHDGSEKEFLQRYYDDLVYPALDRIFEIALAMGYSSEQSSKVTEYHVFTNAHYKEFSHNYSTAPALGAQNLNSCIGLGSSSQSWISSRENLITYHTERNPKLFNYSTPIFRSEYMDLRDIMRKYILQEFYLNRVIEISQFASAFQREIQAEFGLELAALEHLGKVSINGDKINFNYTDNIDFGIYSKFFWDKEDVQRYFAIDNEGHYPDRGHFGCSHIL